MFKALDLIGSRLWLHDWVVAAGDKGFRESQVPLSVVAESMHFTADKLQEYALGNAHQIISGAHLAIEGSNLIIRLDPKWWPLDAAKTPKALSAKPESPISRKARLEAEARGYDAGLDAALAKQQDAARKATPASIPKPEEVPVPMKSQKETPEEIERRCKEEWRTSAELRTEFGTLVRYVAYCKAEARGQTQVFGRGTAQRLSREDAGGESGAQGNG